MGFVVGDRTSVPVSARRALCGEVARADIDIQAADKDRLFASIERAVAKGFGDRREVNQNIVLRQGPAVLDFSKRAFYPTADECIAHHDFTVCQFALFFEGGTLTMLHTTEAVYDLMNNVLMPVEAGVMAEKLSKALRRSRKYARQGFSITPETLAQFVSIATKAKADAHHHEEAQRPGLARPDPG